MFGRTVIAAGITGMMTVCAAAQTYHVQDLGTLGGLGDTQAFGLSRTGVQPLVAGFATRADHGLRGFVFNGALQELSPLAPDTQSVAYGVDGIGRTVGVMFQLGNPVNHAFRVDPDGTLAFLGDFTARGVNQNGDIAGYRSAVETVGLAGELLFDRAITFRDGSGAPVVTDLGTLGASHWSRAYGIGDDGTVVGCSGQADDSGTRAVAWAAGATRDLGTVGGTEACAYGINSSGLVCGYSSRGSNPEVRAPVTWQLSPTGQVMQTVDLGTLPAASGAAAGWGYAYGLNTRGAVVGASSGRAFLHEYGQMKDLNTLVPPGWFIVAARAINDSDAIAAWGVNSANEPRALLLTRCDADFGRDGAVTVQDLFDFLGAYFSADPRADVDHSGGITVQDIFDFLAAWFTGC